MRDPDDRAAAAPRGQSPQALRVSGRSEAGRRMQAAALDRAAEREPHARLATAGPFLTILLRALATWHA